MKNNYYIVCHNIGDVQHYMLDNYISLFYYILLYINLYILSNIFIFVVWKGLNISKRSYHKVFIQSLFLNFSYFKDNYLLLTI